MKKTIEINFTGWKAGLLLACTMVGAIDIIATPFMIYFGKFHSCI